MNPIFRCANGKHVDLSKIVAITPPYLDSAQIWGVNELSFYADVQLSDHPVAFNFSVMDFPASEEKDWDRGELNKNEEGKIIFHERIRKAYEELLQAWQDYRATL